MYPEISRTEVCHPPLLLLLPYPVIRASCKTAKKKETEAGAGTEEKGGENTKTAGRRGAACGECICLYVRVACGVQCV